MNKRVKLFILSISFLLTACLNNDAGNFGYVTKVNQISGITWRLDNVSRKGRQIKPLKGHQPTLFFREDGLVKGYSGLNKFFGRFVLSPGSRSISLGSGFGKEHNQGNESVMKQELGYFKALKGEHEIYRHGDELFLNHQDKKLVLVFKKTD
ncbi:MAG: META domain-containing protein [Lentisphaeria bacterium]|nr:META domain-containing protein [Lentisphaeria bacterium]